MRQYRRNVQGHVLYLSSLAAVPQPISNYIEPKLANLQQLPCTHHDGTKPCLALTVFVAN